MQGVALAGVAKLAGIVIVFWGTMGRMTQRLTDFFSEELIPMMAGS